MRGIDNRPVEPYRERKSIGKEETFESDVLDKDFLKEILKKLCAKVCKSLIKHGEKGRTLTLKIKYFNFKSITRSYTGYKSVYLEDELYKLCTKLLDLTDAGKVEVRLVGFLYQTLILKDSLRSENFRWSSHLAILFIKELYNLEIFWCLHL